MVFTQYKHDGKAIIAINNKDIWKLVGSYSYELSEKLEFERTYDYVAQDEEKIIVESDIPILALVKGADSNNIAFFHNSEEFIRILSSGNIIRIYYYGQIGFISDCKWKIKTIGSVEICQIFLGNNGFSMTVVIGENDIESESVENIIVEQGIAYEIVSLPSELQENDIVLNKSITFGEEFEKEKRKLGGVVFAIKGKISEIEAKTSYVDRYATISGGDDGTEFAQLQHNKRVSQSDYEKIDWLNQRADIPYRYRVDLKKDDEVQKCYLGPVGVSEEDVGRGNRIISYFSEVGKKLATYNPNDKKINSEIKLRREFNISRSVLRDYRNIIGTVTSESSEFREGLYDPFLIDIFKKRRESREIKDIIVSIQENQNKIVDVSGNENVIVQGCAGSGKTMVMMHRMSKLLNWDKAFDAREVVIIGPSKQYKSYMQNVLEGLSISSITQTTIEDYYNELIAGISKEFVSKSVISSETSINEAFLRYVYSSDYLKKMDTCIADISEKQDSFKSELALFLKCVGEDDNYVLDVPVYQFYDHVTHILKEIKSKKEEKKSQIQRLKERINNLKQRQLDLENGVISMARADYENQVSVIVDQVKERLQETDNPSIRDLIEHNVSNNLDSKLLFLFKLARIDPDTEKDLIACEMKDREIQELERELHDKPNIIESEKERLEELISHDKDDNFNDALDDITRKAETYKNTKLYTTIVDEITRDILIGQNIKKPRGIHRFDLYSRLQFCIKFFNLVPPIHKYLFIDEGQDISFIEYELLNLLGGNNTVFNIFGDLNQVINHGHGMSDWRSLKKLFPYKMFYLEENYRNSNQITRYCNDKFSLSMREIGINAAEVKEISKDEFEYEIVTDSKPQLDRWIILLDRSIDKKKFIKSMPTNKLTSDQIGCNEIAVMYVDEIKGFEFDRVYVISSNMNLNMKYVAYTRALNELLIVNW